MGIRTYVDGDGRVPFESWLERLRDVRARAAIRARLARLEAATSAIARRCERVRKICESTMGRATACI